MHLKTNIDITKFLMSIKNCEGQVLFETPEGDRLNLTSALSQYIFCSAIGQSFDWNQGTIRCEISDDILILTPYLEINT